jgi:hypothetical protein
MPPATGSHTRTLNNGKSIMRLLPVT